MRTQDSIEMTFPPSIILLKIMTTLYYQSCFCNIELMSFYPKFYWGKDIQSFEFVDQDS